MNIKRACVWDILVIGACLLWGGGPVWAGEPVDVMVFTSPYCPHCRQMEQDGFVERFAAQHEGEINLTRYDVTQNGGNIVFLGVLQNSNIRSAGIPAMVIDGEVLQGYPAAIASRCEEVLKRALQKQRAQETEEMPLDDGKEGDLSVQNAKQTLTAKTEEHIQPAKQKMLLNTPAPINVDAAQTAHSEKQNLSHSSAAAADLAQHEAFFNQITAWAIIGAGLADGINPCAFAVIVFFISFLAVYKYNRKEIVLVGAAYCVSVFTAYMLLGLGFFRFLYALKGLAYVTLVVQWVTIVLCAAFFVLSFYDFWIYRKTKQSDKMLLQLPRSYKEYIHKVMRFFLKSKHSSSWRLVLAACCVGFVVSLVEAVCTGQVYLPTIMVILKESHEHFFKAVAYLVLYNLMFVVPLILVFVLTLCGKESVTFNNWLKKHLGLTKLLLCGVFLGLLLLLLFNF